MTQPHIAIIDWLTAPQADAESAIEKKIIGDAANVTRHLCDTDADIDNEIAAAGAIIFSGMAHDAIDGAAYLASKGGTVWAQDPNTCVISSMVDGAIDAGVVSHTASPVDLARRFNQQFGAG